MNHKLTRSLSVFVAILIALSFISYRTQAQDTVLPERVVIEYTNLFPEGVEYDSANDRFLVGSLAEGTIHTVADDGSLIPFVEDADLGQSIGIHIDEERGRLLVANFNPAASEGEGAKVPVSLGIYGLESGERIDMVDLTDLLPNGFSFVNDVTVDADGNVYVTDMMAAAIYQVDMDGNASVFVQSEQFNDQFGLNGIEYHPDGYLIAGRTLAGALFKIPLDDPQMFTEVEIDAAIATDGLTLHPDGYLVVVGGYMDEEAGGLQPAILSLASDDDWQSATVTAQVDLDRGGSTAAIRDGAVYTVLSDSLAFGPVSSGDMPAIETFEIIRIEFDSMD